MLCRSGDLKALDICILGKQRHVSDNFENCMLFPRWSTLETMTKVVEVGCSPCAAQLSFVLSVKAVKVFILSLCLVLYTTVSHSFLIPSEWAFPRNSR